MKHFMRDSAIPLIWMSFAEINDVLKSKNTRKQSFMCLATLGYSKTPRLIICQG